MEKIKFMPVICSIFLAICFSCGRADLPPEVEAAYHKLPDQLDFNIHVKPILSDKCFACHGPDQGNIKAGLRLDTPQKAFAELPESPGEQAIVPGNLKKSQVFHRITSSDPEVAMPPQEFKVKLTDHEKAVLVKWIKDGAKYKAHWAFIKPEKPAVPQVKNKTFAHNPIDNFVLQKLEGLALRPSAEADRDLLLRRLSLDLTGLPPSVAEIDAFIADHSENAYEQQVDRLLSSVHYGEKMATDWMDVARYSDTYGYQVDRYRDMSPWRDWVIQAFNENMPYDQFLTWQLAGDLLPNATREQILATGFNRLHPQNMEGGIVDEEFRVENVADRVAVLGDGLLGLTLSCAKCHDHKFDPISQKEYYELFAFFNNINETGQIAWDKTTPVPNLLLPTEKQKKILIALRKDIELKKENLRKISEAEKTAISAWIEKAGYRALGNGLPKNGLVARYPLDNKLVNTVNLRQQPKMEREFSSREVPNFTDGHQDRALLLDGDAWLDCKEVGIFKRSEAFTIGLWAYFPKDLKEGVIFHKNKGSRLHSFRGYHLYLNSDNQLEWLMARTWPDNAIIEHTIEAVPRDQWVQLTVSYDGSSTAAGTKIFINGEEARTEIKKDNLYKDIVFNYLEDIIYPEPIEPNLQIGARWRGTGIKNASVDEIVVYNRQLTALEIQQIAKPEDITVAENDPTELSKQQKLQLENYYLANFSNGHQTALQQLHGARTTLVDSMEKVREIMVMREMKEPRKTYILNRGLYDAYGEEVFPNTPKSVMAMPEELPKNRLGLAKWLTHPQHPLTARVAVNRYWQHYFGRGLVKTAQDFGNQGELPTHPELLDWLAVQFIESGWDVKALQKLIVMSATYRQSSHADQDLLEKDKDNVWLARAPSIRLASEMIRDNALAASGLLNRKVGGESVYPYQPEGLWAMNFDPYPQDTGDKLYRRSLYTMWRRTIPNPTLATFDQPERNVCTVKRQKTNTPLQALVLLNDPTFVEAAKVIGEKMTRIGDPEMSIRMAYTRVTGKKPTEKELKLLLDLREKEYEILKSDPQKAKGWLEAGEYKIDPDSDQQLIAANAIVASVILNGDVAITKR